MYGYNDGYLGLAYYEADLDKDYMEWYEQDIIKDIKEVQNGLEDDER